LILFNSFVFHISAAAAAQNNEVTTIASNLCYPSVITSSSDQTSILFLIDEDDVVCGCTMKQNENFSKCHDNTLESSSSREILSSWCHTTESNRLLACLIYCRGHSSSSFSKELIPLLIPISAQVSLLLLLAMEVLLEQQMEELELELL
jgi:hypothetical protein